MCPKQLACLCFQCDGTTGKPFKSRHSVRRPVCRFALVAVSVIAFAESRTHLRGFQLAPKNRKVVSHFCWQEVLEEIKFTRRLCTHYGYNTVSYRSVHAVGTFSSTVMHDGAVSLVS